MSIAALAVGVFTTSLGVQVPIGWGRHRAR
jgi:hypothetical protein